MDFTITAGKKGTSQHYLSQGFRYSLTQVYSGTKYLRCTLWKTNPWNCPGKGHIYNMSSLLIVKMSHSHTIEDYNSESIDLKNKLKRAAENSTLLNLREIFDEQTRNDAAGASISFRNVRSTMAKRRKTQFPRLPNTPEAFQEKILQSHFVDCFRGSVTLEENEGSAVIFISDLMMNKLVDAKKINYDATFFVVPKIFYQLFTIFFHHDGHSFPCIHVLMSRKTETLYIAVLRKILEIVPDFKPEFAGGDYEIAPRNAFKCVFPLIDINGCLFHFCQAIWRRTKKLKLSYSYSRNEQFNKWLKCVMALALLPQQEIGPIFQQLSQDNIELTNDAKKSKQKLVKYINTEWTCKEGVSVYESSMAYYILRLDKQRIAKNISRPLIVFCLIMNRYSYRYIFNYI